MTIRRKTTIHEEWDDSESSQYNSTDVPNSLAGTSTHASQFNDQTQDRAEKSGSSEEDPAEGHNENFQTVGRTYSDLFAESVRNSKLMATLFTFVPIPFFADSIKQFTDLFPPLMVTSLLCVVWFAPSLFAWIVNKVSRR